jgi:hypothetical protein
MRGILAPVSALVAAVFFVADASAQVLCGPRAQVVRQLESKYDERPTAFAVTADGGALEVYAAPSGRTWTILVTRPDGVACLVAHGEDWQDLPTQVSGPSS